VGQLVNMHRWQHICEKVLLLVKKHFSCSLVEHAEDDRMETKELLSFVVRVVFRGTCMII
jgi:hypothetical protein